MSKKKVSKKSIVVTILAIIIALFFPSLLNDNLEIHYIDVGQADSILITLNGSSMLIDAGNNGDGDDVVAYLKQQNITKLDYLIGTHPHEDHIGGLDDVIDNFDIDTVLMPKTKTNTKTFESVLDSMLAKNLKITTVNIGDTFNLDTATFTVLSVENESTDNLNTTSIVIRLVYENQSYIFCGDAEIENEEMMLSSNLTLESNVIKIGHHGSYTSSSEEFIKAVNPKTAIISVGTDNTYDHPSKSTIKLLEKYNIEVFRTDLNGTIVITSDGTSNKIKCERN